MRLNIRKLFIFIFFFIIFLFIIVVISFLLKAKEPIKIGFCGVLTGTSSELGISARNGVKILFDSINEKGGIRGRYLQLIIKDDENNEDTGLKAVEDLHKEKVVAIIGHITSAATGKSFDYINKNKILMISPSVSTAIYNDKDDYFIRVVSSSKIQAQALARKVIKDNKKRIIVIYDLKNKIYTENTFNFFKNEIENLGSNILNVQTFISEENINFYDIIKNLIKYKPDSFLLLCNGMDSANICQQIRKFKKDIDIYAGLWAMTKDLIIYGGKSVEGVYIYGEIDINDNSQKYLEFKNKYFEKYKVIPSFSAIYGYEAARVLAIALEKSKKWDSDSLKNTIIKISKFEGLQKDYIINEFGDTEREHFLFTVKEGEFVRIE